MCHPQPPPKRWCLTAVTVCSGTVGSVDATVPERRAPMNRVRDHRAQTRKCTAAVFDRPSGLNQNRPICSVDVEVVKPAGRPVTGTVTGMVTGMVTGGVSEVKNNMQSDDEDMDVLGAETL